MLVTRCRTCLIVVHMRADHPQRLTLMTSGAHRCVLNRHPPDKPKHDLQPLL